jgi:hypothetical protein
MKKLFFTLLFPYVAYITNSGQDSINILLTDTLILNDSIVGAKKTLDTTITPDAEIRISDSLMQLSIDTMSSLPDTINKTIRNNDTISLVLAGDVMLGTNYPSTDYLPPGNNCTLLLENVRQYLQSADLAICNLEGVFAGQEGSPKNCKDPKTCYVFRMPDEYANCLIEAGFDVVSVANNHVNDFGYQGRMHSVQVLKDAGLHFAGFVEYPFTILEIDSIKIGYCAFAPHSGVADMRNAVYAEGVVKYLADSCNIVLVSVHAGGEGQDFQHVTQKNEIFLGADRGNVYQFAHRMIDAGADVIIGHGPHVTRAMEVYNNRFIAYSLGNFCTYSRFNLSGPNGIAPLVRLFIDAEGRIISGNIIPVKQSGEGGAEIDPDKKVIFKLQDLQRTDFPNEKLSITNDGSLIFISPP